MKPDANIIGGALAGLAVALAVLHGLGALFP
jgi:hypothetical protein